ncbi:MAG: Ig-like domain-containing protein [Thermodesulfovibrionales bacterium]
MKRFKTLHKTLQTYLLFILILSVFLISGCGGGDSAGTGNWLPSSAPTVTSTDPVDAATGICSNKIVTAVFSKAMDASTITAAGTFTVKETATGNNKPGVVTYNATTRTATFTRTTNYTTGLSYTATITTAAKDTEGNALAANKVWSFTIGATVCANPSPPGIADPVSCAGPGPVDLGTAASFGVLVGPAGGATFTITNPTSVTGDTGAASYVPAGGVSTLVGTKYTGVDALYVSAKADMLTAIACAEARTCNFNYAVVTDFGTVAVTPGVHCVTAAMSVSTPLTINTPGVYVFRSTGALTSAVNATVAYGGTANASNTSIFWVPTGAATLLANTTFLGTIMPGSSAAITLGANSTVTDGRLLSNSDVTVNTNTIAIP